MRSRARRGHTNGRAIAYQVDDVIDHVQGDYGWDVATLDIASGTEKILTRGFAEHAILPVWSPDDRHVLFLTAAGPGVVLSDGMGLHVFGNKMCDWMEPSPDGSIATCASGNEVILYSIEGGGQPTVIEAGGPVDYVNWQRTARSPVPSGSARLRPDSGPDPRRQIGSDDGRRACAAHPLGL